MNENNYEMRCKKDSRVVERMIVVKMICEDKLNIKVTVSVFFQNKNWVSGTIKRFEESESWSSEINLMGDIH